MPCQYNNVDVFDQDKIEKYNAVLGLRHKLRLIKKKGARTEFDKALKQMAIDNLEYNIYTLMEKIRLTIVSINGVLL